MLKEIKEEKNKNSENKRNLKNSRHSASLPVPPGGLRHRWLDPGRPLVRPHRLTYNQQQGLSFTFIYIYPVQYHIAPVAFYGISIFQYTVVLDLKGPQLHIKLFLDAANCLLCPELKFRVRFSTS